MRVLVCSTAFKGTLTAREATEAMAEGLRQILPAGDLRSMPVSDGGPGLLEAIATASEHAAARTPELVLDRVRVTGPLGGAVEGRILRLPPDEAVIESADACGLERLAADGSPTSPGRRGGRAPLEAHTLGVGELVRRALEGGARRVRIGLGGSASTDAGTGLGRAFGFRFLDAEGRELPPGGRALPRLARIEPGRAPEGELLALCDVENPLTGPRGSARAFGPQKGATPEEVELLEAGLGRVAERLRVDLGADVADLQGAGAAGGLGAGCAAFLGARLTPGSEWVLDRVGFDAALARSDLVVTGEGRWDETSRQGKVVGRVLERAEAKGIRVLVLCGRIDPEDAARLGRRRRLLALDGGGRRLDSHGLAELAAAGARSLLDR